MPGRRTAEAARWLSQASYDLKAARWNSEGGFHDTACFLAQQAAEKALKSLLYHLGARRKALLTHSVVEMVRDVESQVPALAGLLDDARQLDLHYIPSRYPNGLPSGFPHQFYDTHMAERAIAGAERILACVSDYHRVRGEVGLPSEET